MDPSAVDNQPTLQEKLSVAIVHDWLIGGGAERVVYELHKMFPDAPIFTSYCSNVWRERLDNKVVTGFLQKQPFPKLRKYVPFLRTWWFSRLDLSKYALVISSSGAEAKGIKSLDNQIHICYMHAPTHYYWSRYDEYMKNPGFGLLDPLARLGLKLLVGPMRRWDFKAAQGPKYIIANSTHTQNMIKKFYGRESVVIHPPVDIERFQAVDSKQQAKRRGFVIAGRQTPYKRIDLAVAACTKLGLPLTVIGSGPDHQKLRNVAGPSVTFITNASDVEVVNYFSAAQAFIFPGLDDFGIVAVEAMAAGTPVIAYKAGGALDYVIPGKTGEFFDEQNEQSLINILQSFDPSKYIPSDIKQAARRFDTANFHKNLQEYIAKVLK